ncbi:hypothetical protein GCM10009730_32820 [Streptomyces albidochromogenes]|uniref:DUF3618 domain-containing protein n=1 Tax=Streptomyces albidochromogenes TaxID=329524 RepID=UPI00142EA641|nr:DUF3618 domain-containing protein [Streptomyces albidochromogenes]
MTIDPQDNGSTPTPDELREQVDGTRRELGPTAEGLAAEADAKAQAPQEAAVESRSHGAAGHALHLVQDTAPEPVREKAAQTKEQIARAAAAVADKFQEKAPDPVREKVYLAAESGRGNLGLVITGAAALALLVLVRRQRKVRR